MKKKGFTLIELLAVIVILGIIALIVGATIGGIIERTRKESYKQSVIGVIQAGENYIVKYLFEHNGVEPTYPLIFRCDGTSCSNGADKLDFQGAVPKSGAIKINSVKDVHAEYITDGKYCSYGPKESVQVVSDCADIDMNAPTVSVESEGLVLKITMNDYESGIASYCVTTTNDSSTCNWVNTTDTYKEHEVEESGTYYIFVKDNRGNISSIVNSIFYINFSRQILNDNNIVLTAPTLTTTSAEANESGLYSIAVTNGYSNQSDGTTYYFRGNVINNYVSFAGLTWRIVRINEDNTIRLILNNPIDTTNYVFNGGCSRLDAMYYSNSLIKPTLDTWYDNAIGSNNTYASKIANGQYFCESMMGNRTNPDFSCVSDQNNHGLLDNTYKVGLITYDELMFAGGYLDKNNTSYYLYGNYTWWSMSPYVYDYYAYTWHVLENGNVHHQNYSGYTCAGNRLRPVINLKSTVTVTGTGTSADPYVVE